MKFIRISSFYFLAGAGYLAVAFCVSAQDTVVPPDSSVVSENEFQALEASTATPETSTSPVGRNPDVTTGRPVAAVPRRFQYSFSVTARGVYDDNIFISTGSPTSDYYFTIEPSISIGLGGEGGERSLGLIYNPSLFLFVDHDENDSIQHVIQLKGGYTFGHLGLSVTQDVQILDGQDLNSISDPTGHQANIDVGARAQHQTYSTSIEAYYDLTGKLFISATGGFAADEYNSLISSESFSGNMYLNYNYSDKLTVGVGGTGGYNTTDNSVSDQTFEQVNARVNYNATGKIALSASGGVEFRQAENKSESNISPVFELSASYQPFDGTSVTVSGSRRTMNSAVLAGQDFAETMITAALSQRFMRRFSLGLAVGYTNSDYFSVIDGLTATRRDDYFYVEPSVDATVTRYCSVGGYFLHREDSSSFAVFDFEDNQVGFRCTLKF